MEKLILPNGSQMPSVGLGTFSLNDPLELRRAMEAAFECGYRHFDTAFLYDNENIVGKVIDGWLRKGLVKREELFITTKLPLAGVHPERAIAFFLKSLANLDLQYIDLYLIHFPICTKYDPMNNFPVDELGRLQTEPTDLVAVWRVLEEFLQMGRVKNIGLSNFSQRQIANILENTNTKPANLQIESNLYHQNGELIEFCRENGISVVAYSPLGSPAIDTHNQSYGLPLRNSPKMLEDPFVVELASKYSKTPAQILLRFQLQRGVAVIPKSSNPERIRENIDIFDFEIDASDMEKLRKLDRGKDGKICHMKGFGMETHPEFPF